MARRAIIRSRSIGTDVAQIEEMIKADYHDIWREHMEDLESIAEMVQSSATELVPLDKGKLRASINVHVSKSRRYPGIIAHASAVNHGFDYALIQDENENYSHEDDRMAHYLSGTFARELAYWYENATGEELELPDNLQAAADYVGEGGL